MIDTTDMSTEDVLRIALDYAKDHSIPRVVVATTKGDTGIAAANIFNGKGRIQFHFNIRFDTNSGNRSCSIIIITADFDFLTAAVRIFFQAFH